MLANANLINGLIILVVMILCYLFILIPFLIYYAIQHMRSPQLILLPEEDWGDYLTGKCRAEADWSQTNQFVAVGVYRWQQNYIIVWENDSLATFFQTTLSPYGRFHSFTTIFEESNTLITANDREALIFPAPPGRYVQSFGVEQTGILNEKHQVAIEDLKRVKRLELAEEFPEFEESYLAGLRQQHEFVRSVFFYPIRGIWWYHVGRRVKYNRPIDLEHVIFEN
ncbi:hypothetical protein [Gimesia sp.]|uniref:hypothetical protein n=1 Tax=Gimesia sp. TaxID=2024833 RepID=UPI000C3C309C|nr:hypothetical protein [Gimesia sp.]MAX36904.1 hypothetical protein [Gimesia sp.]HAH48046.1 hypothetical protein [Planctomycetaceae bacterium]HBL43627.1 hypothetical protein [Planctomycetaceae bacterium]|tara:strand:+ start:106 stop:780 length:675 start_codon:yes stop_codon:yes gene_type:complete